MNDEITFWLSLIQVDHQDKKRLLRYNTHKLIWRSFPHLPPKSKQPFLFSITDKADSEGIYCYVQSEMQPEWANVMNQPDMLPTQLTKIHGVKRVTIPTREGIRYSFNLEVSPVKNVFRSTTKRGSKAPMKSVNNIEKWFEKRSVLHGFRPLQLEISNRIILVRNNHLTNANDIRLSHCDINGILMIQSSNEFSSALLSGIGTKKSFGFGMIKLASASAY